MTTSASTTAGALRRHRRGVPWRWLESPSSSAQATTITARHDIHPHAPRLHPVGPLIRVFAGQDQPRSPHEGAGACRG
jgi:hypothetical protein